MTTKYWALLVIVPLFVGILIGMSVQTHDAEAIKAKGTGLSSPKSYGSATAGIVCGDKLCSEISTPSASFPIDVYMLKRDALNTYTVHFKVTAGDQDLENIIIEGKSDIFAHEIVIESLRAFESTEGIARVKALDINSMTGEIVAFQLAG